MHRISLFRNVAFVALLWVPLVGLASGPGTLYGEKRPTTPYPELTLKDLRTYPERYDAYFADNFGLRQRVIHLLAKFSVDHLKESPIPNVIMGGHDRLYFAAVGNGIGIADFAGRWPVWPNDVEQWIGRSILKRAQYATMGAQYLIVIAPNKESIYPEDVPARFGPHMSGTLDALMTRARQVGDLDILDLRQSLLPHRREEPLYYNTDTHWNRNGAFWAAQALVDQVRPWFPDVVPLDRQDYAIVGKPHATADNAGDLAQMLSMPDDFHDVEYVYQRQKGQAATLIFADACRQVYEQPYSTLPHVVLIGDSFGEALGAALADSFGRVYRYNSYACPYDPSLILQEKPALVVFEAVERFLPRLMDQ